jgi:site-specific recombinase XerD
MKADTNPNDAIVAIEAFIRQMRSSGYAEATVRSYAKGLKAFGRYLEEKRVQCFRQVTRELMEDYRTAIMTTPLAPESKALKLRPVKRLFEHLVASNRLLLDPCTGWVEISRRQRPIEPVLTTGEVQRLLSVANRRTPVGFRNRVIMSVLYSTGIRLGELVGLLLADVDLDSQVLCIRRGKGAVQRVVPLGEKSSELLTHYLKRTRALLDRNQGRSQVLFLTARGTPITPGAISAFLGQYRTKAGITTPVSAHVFRRTCATHFLQNGAGIRFVQQLLGHSSLRVTHQYTRVLPVALKRTHEKTHPGVENAAD